MSSASTSLLAMYSTTSRRTCFRSCLMGRFLLLAWGRVRRVRLVRLRLRLRVRLRVRLRRRRVLRGGFRAVWDCCGRRRVWRLWRVCEGTFYSWDWRSFDVLHVHVIRRHLYITSTRRRGTIDIVKMALPSLHSRAGLILSPVLSYTLRTQTLTPKPKDTALHHQICIL